jgi:flagellar export protein FliJ
MTRGNPFDVLVRLRKIDERQRRAALAAARQAHEDARERLEEYKERHRQSLELDEMLSPVELRSLQLRGLQTHEDLVAAADTFARARITLDDRIDGWRRSAEDLDAAERLDQRRKDESARLARIAADRTLDELLAVMHGRRPEASS